MVWFKIDDGLYSHPKVLGIDRQHRLAAIGQWALAGSYCAHYLTDGGITVEQFPSISGNERYADVLVHCGLWIPVNGGYQFHDWSSYQPSRARVEGERERVKKWREHKRAERRRRDQEES